MQPVPAGSARGGVDALERGVHQDLGLWARDEHALLAAQDNVAEGHLARDVLEGLAGGAALDAGMHAVELVRSQRAIEVDVELHTREARGVAQQPLGRVTRVLVAATPQVAAGPLEDSPDGPGLLLWHGWPF